VTYALSATRRPKQARHASNDQDNETVGFSGMRQGRGPGDANGLVAEMLAVAQMQAGGAALVMQFDEDYSSYP
jgi:hypothetical protein